MRGEKSIPVVWLAAATCFTAGVLLQVSIKQMQKNSLSIRWSLSKQVLALMRSILAYPVLEWSALKSGNIYQQ